MNLERVRLLDSMEALIEKANKIIEMAQKRNLLEKEYAEPIRQHEKDRQLYAEAIGALEKIGQISKSKVNTEEIIEKIRADVKQQALDMESIYTKLQESAELTNQIDKLKEEIYLYISDFVHIQLRESEITRDNISALIILFLAANYVNSELSQNSFIECPNSFVTFLSKNRDIKIVEIVYEPDASCITKYHSLDYLLVSI